MSLTRHPARGWLPLPLLILAMWVALVLIVVGGTWGALWLGTWLFG